MDIDPHSHQLRTAGFTVFERLFEQTWVDALRADILGIHEALGRPPLHASAPRQLAPGIELCAAGLAIRSLLTERPAWAATLFAPKVIAAIRPLLGDDLILEIAGAVISDHTRPFFPWHSHIGGVDDGVYWRRGTWPNVTAPQRIMALLYLQDLTDDTGPMLVYPRRIGDDTAPPFARTQQPWPGQLELRPPAGSIIALEQCTWHAIKPTITPTPRIFVGLTFATRTTPPGAFVDPTLAGWSANTCAGP